MSAPNAYCIDRIFMEAYKFCGDGFNSYGTRAENACELTAHFFEYIKDTAPYFLRDFVRKCKVTIKDHPDSIDVREYLREQLGEGYTSEYLIRIVSNIPPQGPLRKDSRSEDDWIRDTAKKFVMIQVGSFSYLSLTQDISIVLCFDSAPRIEVVQTVVTHLNPT